MNHTLIHSILAEFGLNASQARIVTMNSAGGFSGALFWKVEVDGKHYCLRRWPNQIPMQKLNLIHRALLHASRNGCDFLPVPLVHVSGSTYCRRGQHAWELTDWLEGEANFWSTELPTTNETADLKNTKLKNAALALAQFHLAVADLEPVIHICSPAVTSRLSQLRRWMRGDAERITHAVRSDRSPQLEILKDDHLAENILSAFQLNAGHMDTQLAAAESLPVPVQTCIKDVWHDHILFTKDRVTGIVDFGAMSIDTVACDIARLFGSLVADDLNAWSIATDAYNSKRLLQENERHLIGILDRSTTVMAGMNWLHWIFLENRQFEDLAAVRGRLQRINARLRNLACGGHVLE